MLLPFGPILCPSKLNVRSEDINAVCAGDTGASVPVPSAHQKAVQLMASLVFLKSKYILPCL